MDKKLEVEGLLGGLECHFSLQQTWNLEIGEALAKEALGQS